MKNDAFVSNREKRRKLIEGIKKHSAIQTAITELVALQLEDARTQYEDTGPASEFLRGRLVALKELHKYLTS